MSEKDFNMLMELADELLKRVYTKEEALRELIDAGIFNENGDYTKPYEILGTVTSKQK